MQSKLIRIVALTLVVFVSSADLLAEQKRAKKAPPLQSAPREVAAKPKEILRAPSGPSFYIEQISETRNQYSLLLTDSDNRSVAGTFLLSQLSLFQALMVAAKDFGETTESAGTTAKPVTTRFMDKGEPSFVIDVEKTATHSRFYVSMTSLAGKVTVNAGAVKRGSKDQGNPLFFALLSRVNAVIAESK
ncbi:MAG: hypothetical protein AABO41_17420 [Acidobacteriota bacterium]